MAMLSSWEPDLLWPHLRPRWGICVPYGLAGLIGCRHSGLGMNLKGFSRIFWFGTVFAISLCAALMGLAAYETFGNLPEATRDRALIDHSFDVISTARALELSIQDAETSQRGYLLTGEDSYLEPYRAGIRAVPIFVNRLNELTKDSEAQQQRTSVLVRQISLKLAELQKTILLRQKQGFESAKTLVLTNIGRQAMLNIRKSIDTLVAVERAQLRQQLLRSSKDERIGIAIATSSGALALTLLLLGFFIAFEGIKTVLRSEKRQSDLEERFEMLVNGVSEYALFMMDTQGRITSWNKGAQRIEGYSADEIMGKHFSVFYTEQDRRAGLPAIVLQTANQEGKYEAEGWRVRKDGSQFMAQVVVNPVHNQLGQLIGFAKITRDITEQYQQRETLEKTRSLLLQSQKMEALGQLTGGIAHDFNNLLQVMQGGISLLRRRLPTSDPKLEHYLDVMGQGTERAAALTKRLLAYVRRQPLNPKPIDINKMVTGLTGILQRTLGENISMETRLQTGVWRIYADVSQLENTIINLLVNARDAMPNGGKLTIETSNTYLDQSYAGEHIDVAPGRYVVLAITDTGLGMTKETLEKAFEPYFTTKDQGTGLGLSQVYGFIKQSGGHAKIDSHPGKGTTVKTYLPRLESLEDAQISPQFSSSKPSSSRQETILVVEDDDEVCDFTAEMLRDLDYGVIIAHDAFAALSILSQQPGIDLLFTDIVLAGALDGRQLAEQARQSNPQIKILFTTGYARNAMMHNGHFDPEIELITKPFTQQEVATRLRQLFGG